MAFGRGGWRPDAGGLAPGHRAFDQARGNAVLATMGSADKAVTRPDNKTVYHIEIDNMPMNKSASALPTDKDFFRGNRSGEYRSDVNTLITSASRIF